MPDLQRFSPYFPIAAQNLKEVIARRQIAQLEGFSVLTLQAFREHQAALLVENLHLI